MHDHNLFFRAITTAPQHNLLFTRFVPDVVSMASHQFQERLDKLQDEIKLCTELLEKQTGNILEEAHLNSKLLFAWCPCWKYKQEVVDNSWLQIFNGKPSSYLYYCIDISKKKVNGLLIAYLWLLNCWQSPSKDTEANIWIAKHWIWLQWDKFCLTFWIVILSLSLFFHDNLYI